MKVKGPYPISFPNVTFHSNLFIKMMSQCMFLKVLSSAGHLICKTISVWDFKIRFNSFTFSETETCIL